MAASRAALRVIMTRAASTKASEDPCPCPKPAKISDVTKSEAKKPDVKKSNVSALKRFVYNWSGFNKYGLCHNDCLDETEDVKEALRRLPQAMKDERNFRLLRAMQLSMMKVHLPKEEWTKVEEDVQYLKPYLDEVVKEREEREEWNRNN